MVPWSGCGFNARCKSRKVPCALLCHRSHTAPPGEHQWGVLGHWCHIRQYRNLFFTIVVTNLSLAQLAERETVVFTAISRSSVRLREGRPPQIVLFTTECGPLGERARPDRGPALFEKKKLSTEKTSPARGPGAEHWVFSSRDRDGEATDRLSAVPPPRGASLTLQRFWLLLSPVDTSGIPAASGSSLARVV